MTDIQKKILFVAELSDAIVKVQKNVVNIEYEVYKHSRLDYIDEVLVIHYSGGAKSVRNCTGNSCSAIFEEIASKLRSGYYDELKWYEAIITDKEFIKIFE